MNDQSIQLRKVVCTHHPLLYIFNLPFCLKNSCMISWFRSTAFGNNVASLPLPALHKANVGAGITLSLHLNFTGVTVFLLWRHEVMAGLVLIWRHWGLDWLTGYYCVINLYPLPWKTSHNLFNRHTTDWVSALTDTLALANLLLSGNWSIWWSNSSNKIVV